MSGLKIQYGSIAFGSIASGSTSEVSVTFGSSFSASPYIVMTISNDTTGTGYSALALVQTGRSASGFTARAINNSSATLNPSAHYIAVR